MSPLRSRIALLPFAAFAASSDLAAQRPGRPLIENVARAMGGRDRVLAVRTLVIEGTGDNFNLGQNPSPEAVLPRYEVTEFRRSIDFAGRRWLQDQTRVPRFTTGNTAPQRQRSGYDSVAFNIAADGTVARGSARADVDRADELLHHPIGFIQAALAPGVELTEHARVSGLRHVRMNAGGNKLAMFIEPRTSLPVRIEKVGAHAMLGDVVIETRMSDWRMVDGIRLPMRIAQWIDGRWPLSDLQLKSASLNATLSDIGVTPEVRAAQPPAVAVNVTADSIAPGVWYLTGGSHHSVAIEMRDHLVLVEAPLSDARTLAVIRKARELRPDKPLRSVINTHHHFDHAGGIRAAIAEGLTVVTHAGNARFFEGLARRRHFVVEDALAKSPRPARIERVEGKRILTDGSRSVEIHHISGNPHAGTFLMIYLPAERILIEADAYNPPAANTTPGPAPFAVNLVENIDRLGLRVDRVVPIHGGIFTMGDLRAAALRK